MKITYRPILDSVFGILLAVSLGLNVYQMIILKHLPEPQVDIQDFSGYAMYYKDIKYICGHMKDKAYCIEAYYTEPSPELPPQMSKVY